MSSSDFAALLVSVALLSYVNAGGPAAAIDLAVALLGR